MSWFLGAKTLEELLNVPQQLIHTDNSSRQYIVLTPEAQQLIQQLSSSAAGNEQIQHFTQAFHKVLNAPTPTGGDVQSQTPLQETILSILNNHINTQSNNQDLMSRNRSMSSSMDTSMNGNDSSNSALSSTATSPLGTHMQQGTISLNKIKDEPQHVPTMGGNTSNSSIDRISMEQNELLKKEKKRERNRQVR